MIFFFVTAAFSLLCRETVEYVTLYTDKKGNFTGLAHLKSEWTVCGQTELSLPMS